MSEIKHNGVVQRGADGKLQVEITDGMACESCHIKGACNLGETRDNKLALGNGETEFVEGEAVTVHLSTELAFSALFWAYLFPFIVLISGIIILSLFLDEAMAGLISLVFLVIYYLLIYMNKHYFDRKFSLKINRLKHD